MMINDVITSSNNGEYKRLKSLHKKKYREKFAEYMAEGLRIVEHAYDYDILKKIIIREYEYESQKYANLIDGITNTDIEVTVYADKLFDELSETENSQGLIGLVNYKKDSETIIFNGKSNKLLILDRIQDPGNLGTLIRTADSSGFDCIVLLKGTVDYLNAKVIRSAMGSTMYMPIIQVNDNQRFFDQLKEHDFVTYGTDLNTEYYHFDVDYPQKTAIIIGNEGNGVSDEVLDLSDFRIKIPMDGKAESLNASIAGSIIMYEVVRQHRQSML